MKRTYIIAVIVFVCVFYIHAASKVAISSDSRWSIFVAESLLTDGDAELSEYEFYLKKADFYCIYTLNGENYNLFPVGTSLIALPFVALYDKYPSIVAAIVPGFSHRKINRSVNRETEAPLIAFRLPLERAIASFIVAFCACLIFIIGKQELSTAASLLLTFIFAFCTSVWSTASRGLWQHGPSILMLTITLYLLIQAKKSTGASRERLAAYAGLPLMFSYLVRPTNSISVLIISLYVFTYHRRVFLHYLFCCFIIAAPFFLSNYSVYENILPPYYRPERLAISSGFMEALLGNLISPGRGIFVFSPILLFCFVGVGKVLREKPALLTCCLIIAILHLIVISCFPHWWGGHSFGSRFTSDILPYLMLLLIPALQILDSKPFPSRALFTTIFFMTIGFSFFVHYQGANNSKTIRWNVEPESVDIDTKRLWDLSDLQFLR